MAFNIYDAQDDYAALAQVDPDEVVLHEDTFPVLKETVRETNDYDNGFEASVYVDPSMPDAVSFDIAHVFQGQPSLDEEAVGLLISVGAARALARLLLNVADSIEFA